MYSTMIDARVVLKSKTFCIPDELQNVPVNEAITIILQRSSFSSNECKEIISMVGTNTECLVDLLFSITSESQEQQIFLNSLKTIHYLLAQNIINTISDDAVSFMIENYETFPDEITKIFKKLFENSPEKLFELGIIDFVFSHEDFKPFSQLFPIIVDNLESFPEESQRIIDGVFSLLDCGFPDPQADALACINTLLENELLPETYISRLTRRLSFLIFSEDEKLISLTLDMYISLDVCPTDQSFLLQLFTLLKVNKIGVKVVDFLIHFAEQLQPLREVIIANLNEAIENSSYEISTRSILAAINYVDATEEETKIQLIKLFLSHIENSEFKLEIITCIAELVSSLQEKSKIQEIIDENIEILYLLEDDENPKISELAESVVDFVNIE